MLVLANAGMCMWCRSLPAYKHGMLHPAQRRCQGPPLKQHAHARNGVQGDCVGLRMAQHQSAAARPPEAHFKPM